MESGFEKGTLTSKPASFNRKERIGSQQSAVGKEVFVTPKRVARKRSGGVLLGCFFRSTGRQHKVLTPPTEPQGTIKT
ncbi:hypothetical protein C6500_01600 [Candidatus Poribacteria bacterium]|nr:MAG: hypothetical protein C6500_01600 [Candidatus Poribacteria bacterium]